MAKCKVCNNTYPDKLAACPHCAKAAEQDSDDAIDVFPEDDLPEVVAEEPTLQAMTPMDVLPKEPEDITLMGEDILPPELMMEPMEVKPLLPEGAKEPPGKHIPGFHGTDLQDSGGSSVNLGAELAAHAPATPPPGGASSALLGKSGTHLDSPRSGSLLAADLGDAPMEPAPVKVPKPAPLMSKATKIAPQTAPRTMLAASEAMDVPADPPSGTSMLAGQAGAAQEAQPVNPKATMLATPGAKVTMLAPEDAGRDADPKKTMMAEAGGDKKTHLAAGAAATTKLAMPDEMSALAKEGVAAPKTHLSVGAAPMTKLAKGDEQDALALPEPKKTQLASGAAQMTKLAKGDEQDQLRLEEPVEEEADYGVTASSVDLGSAPRLSAGEMVGDEEVVDEGAVVDEEVAPEQAVAKKPVKKRGGLMMGVVGAGVGIAAAVGLALFDVLPISSLQESLGIKNKETVVKQGDTSDLGIAVLHLDNGNFNQAIAMLNKLDASDKTVLSKRGLARWLQYVQQQKKDNKPLNKADAAVTDAGKDLSDAGNAEAKFWLGHMEEMLSGKEAAKKIYQEGADKFKDQQRMFQSAIERLEAGSDDKGPGAHLQLPGLDDAFAAARLNLAVLFLPAFQAGLPQDAAADEAGYDFWHAAKLAKDKDYAGAVASLRKARETHDKQRFLRLRRAQNPGSDPTEEIFLRASSELITYWAFLDFMKQKGYSDLASAQKVLEDKEAGATLAEVIKLLKSTETKNIPTDLKKLIDDKTKADTQLADVKKNLGNPDDVVAASEKIGKEHKDYLEALMKAATTLKVEKPLDVPTGVEKLAKEKEMFEDAFKKADTLIAGIYKDLVEAKIEGLGKDHKDYAALAKGVKQMIDEAYAPVVKALATTSGHLSMFGKVAGEQVGQYFDVNAQLATSQTSNARYKTLLMQSRMPHQMLDLWLPLLQESRQNKDIAEKAALDARNVQKDNQAEKNVLAEARCVEGLALRNQGKYDDARKALNDSLNKAAGKAGWVSYARAGFDELTDPNYYYIPRADDFRLANRFDDAMSVANIGIDAFKGTKKDGSLLAMRSLIQLDQAKALVRGGRINPKDARVLAADKDAEAAIAAGARAEGFYAQGRVAEELANWAKAQRAYRQALAAASTADREVSSRYRVALARVLLKIPNLPPEEKPEMKGAEEKTGALPTTPALPVERPVTVVYHPISGLVFETLLGFPVDEDEVPETPELDEAIRLAEESIRAGNPEGHLVKGLALAKKGRWTEAVLEYSVGLEKLGRNPDDAKGLRFLMQNHPALRIPDGQMPSDPLEAEKHYAAGLRLYWARRYEDAEREFYHAVRFSDQDARYMYFLGLARLNQGKRSFALEAFRRAGILEQQGKPASASVSATLERVQGLDRQTLNRYRP